ncbi:MAG: Stp1/IreP family PP2C-type Ser/Thr phosphatase [candidate division Zixibacteria bacterium]
MIIKSAGKTDIGLVRKLNEDSIRLAPSANLFIVCDGMGGHNAGEVASATACDIVKGLYCNHYTDLLKDDRLKLPRIFPPSTDVLTKAVRIANHWIYKKASDNSALTGMGTTIVAVVIEEDIITILHAGDSRIYKFANKKLTPLTIDHSWAAELEQNENISTEEAKNLVNRNVITRALGVKVSVDIDVAVRKIVENEIYILCSDGLCGFVDDGDIRDVTAACNEDIDKICDDLVQLANDRGGSDNVSVVAIKITGKVDSSYLPELDTVTVGGESENYYEVEEEWAVKGAETSGDTEETVIIPKKKGVSYLAAIFVIIVLVAIFYIIFKN